MGDVLIFGVTPPYQVVQDYRFADGRPLIEIDVRERRQVVVLGWDIADRLFAGADPIGRDVRILGQRFEVIGVVEKKGRVLGQSFDGFVMLPLSSFESIYGRRQTTTISVKMAEAVDVADGMQRAEEASKLASEPVAPPSIDSRMARAADNRATRSPQLSGRRTSPSHGSWSGCASAALGGFPSNMPPS